jgi:PST family polysaccharide transporter
LARLLAPEEFGLVAMVLSLGGFLVIFIDLGLTDATIQKEDINHTQISTLFWINVIIAAAVALAVIALSPAIAWFYSEPRLANIAMVWSAYLFCAALSTQHIALLKRRMLFFGISLIEVVAAFMSSLLAIVLAMNGWSYWALVFRHIAFATCMSAGAWILCPWFPGRPSFSSGIHSMLKFGRNATFSFIIGYFARNLDKILLGRYFGAGELGYYHRAYYLFVLPATQLTEALKNVATSTLSKLRSEPLKYHSYYLKAVSVLSFMGMPISFFFVIESEDVILLLFGQQWMKSAEIFRLLAPATGIWIIYSTKYWLHASLGKSERLLKWAAIDFVVITVGILLGVRFGSTGVALAYTCTLYMLSGFGLGYAGKPIGLKFSAVAWVTWRYFSAALAGSLICWYTLQVLKDFGIQFGLLERVLFALVLYCSVYLLLVIVLDGGTKAIRELVLIIKEMFRRQG